LAWTGQRLPASGPSFLAGDPDTDQSPDDEDWPEVDGDLQEDLANEDELVEEGH